MERKPWKVYVFWIVVCEAVGVLAGILTRAGSEIYNMTAVKPPLAPPGWVFPVVWMVLYALMGISAARVTLSPESASSSRGLNLMVTQLIVNFFWPLLFFKLQAFLFAFVWLLLLLFLVIAMILAFMKVSKTAAWLQLPYALWVAFAGYLNFGIWFLNR